MEWIKITNKTEIPVDTPFLVIDKLNKMYIVRGTDSLRTNYYVSELKEWDPYFKKHEFKYWCNIPTQPKD